MSTFKIGLGRNKHRQEWEDTSSFHSNAHDFGKLLTLSFHFPICNNKLGENAFIATVQAFSRNSDYPLNEIISHYV